MWINSRLHKDFHGAIVTLESEQKWNKMQEKDKRLLSAAACARACHLKNVKLLQWDLTLNTFRTFRVVSGKCSTKIKLLWSGRVKQRNKCCVWNRGWTQKWKQKSQQSQQHKSLLSKKKNPLWQEAVLQKNKNKNTRLTRFNYFQKLNEKPRATGNNPQGTQRNTRRNLRGSAE